MEIQEPGFLPIREEVELPAGERRPVFGKLILANSRDGVAFARLAAEHGFDASAFPEIPRDRGGHERGMGDGPVALVLPRGPVRAEDLASWQVEIRDGRAVAGGEVVFRRGDEVLSREPLDVRFTPARGEIPDRVRAALAPGDVVTWGCVPPRGEPVLETLEVVDAPAASAVASRLAELDAALSGQPPAVVDLLRARFLLDRGLYLAAYRQAGRVLEAHPDHPVGLAVQEQALARLGLRETDLYAGVLDRRDALPEGALRGIYADEPR